jgi:archaellum component FlaC
VDSNYKIITANTKKIEAELPILKSHNANLKKTLEDVTTRFECYQNEVNRKLVGLQNLTTDLNNNFPENNVKVINKICNTEWDDLKERIGALEEIVQGGEESVQKAASVNSDDKPPLNKDIK